MSYACCIMMCVCVYIYIYIYTYIYTCVHTSIRYVFVVFPSPCNWRRLARVLCAKVQFGHCKASTCITRSRPYFAQSPY